MIPPLEQLNLPQEHIQKISPEQKAKQGNPAIPPIEQINTGGNPIMKTPIQEAEPPYTVKPESMGFITDRKKQNAASFDSEYLERARLYAYKQMLDGTLRSKSPEQYDTVLKQKEQTPYQERNKFADQLYSKGSYKDALTLDDIRHTLDRDTDDFNSLRNKYIKKKVSGNDLLDENAYKNGDTAYGLRNSWSINAPHAGGVDNENAPTIHYTYEISYDPKTKKYKKVYRASDDKAPNENKWGKYQEWIEEQEREK